MNHLSAAIAGSGVCAVTGAIAGSIVGGLFGLAHGLAGSPPAPAASQLWQIAIGLSLVAWALVLLIVGVFGNYGVLAIAARALVTTLVTGIISVWLIALLGAGLLGMLLGWLVGFAVGRALCSACSRYGLRGAA